MNRIDELTLKFADGALTQDEAEELLALVEGDPAAREQHERLLQVEFALREELSLTALREKVMATVDAEHRTQFTERTMTHIRSMPPPRRRRKSPAPLAGVFAMAASLALVAAVAYFMFNADPTAEPTGAWVTASQGKTILQQGGADIPVTGRASIDVGSTIDVQSGYAIVSYDGERTELQLSSGTQLGAQSTANGKHFILREGALSATVAPQPAGRPLLIETPTSVATVVGTSFRLSFIEQISTLEVSEGAVEMAADNGQKVLVSAGRMAEYLPGKNLISRGQNEPSGLISHWTFDESDGERFLDQGATGQKAKARHSPRKVEGPIGNALALDDNQFLEIPHSTAYELPSGSFSFWFNAPNAQRGQSHIILSKRTRVDNIQEAAGFFYISINEQGRLHAQMYSSQGAEIILDSKSPVTNGQWHHVALNFGSDGMQLYLDGQLQGSKEHFEGLARTANMPANKHPLFIGAESFWAMRNQVRGHFPGSIDDLRIYNRALTEAEVGQLAQTR